MFTTTPPAAMPEELETPRDIARVCRTTPQTVNAWHRKGLIPAKICVGRVIRFDRREVLAALQAASAQGGAAK